MYSSILPAALKDARHATAFASTNATSRLHRWLIADWPIDLRVRSEATVVIDEVIECPVVRFMVDGEEWTARAWEFQPYRRTWELRAPHQEHWRRGSKAELRGMLTTLAQEYQTARRAETLFSLSEEPS